MLDSAWNWLRLSAEVQSRTNLTTDSYAFEHWLWRSLEIYGNDPTVMLYLELSSSPSSDSVLQLPMMKPERPSCLPARQRIGAIF